MEVAGSLNQTAIRSDCYLSQIRRVFFTVYDSPSARHESPEKSRARCAPAGGSSIALVGGGWECRKLEEKSFHPRHPAWPPRGLLRGFPPAPPGGGGRCSPL